MALLRRHVLLQVDEQGDIIETIVAYLRMHDANALVISATLLCKAVRRSYMPKWSIEQVNWADGGISRSTGVNIRLPATTYIDKSTSGRK